MTVGGTTGVGVMAGGLVELAAGGFVVTRRNCWMEEDEGEGGKCEKSWPWVRPRRPAASDEEEEAEAEA